MDRGKFALKKIWPFITSILIPIIFLFDIFVIKTGLSKLLFNTIKGLTFRDYILLLIVALISGAYACLYSLNRRVNSISGENINQILNENKHLIRINNELIEKCNKILDHQKKILEENRELKSKVDEFESAEFDPEIYLILETLANRASKIIDNEELWNLHYKKNFKDKMLSDFQIIIDYLNERDLISETEVDIGESFINITRKGLKHLKILKQKIETPI